MKARGRGTKSVRNCARSHSGSQRVIILNVFSAEESYASIGHRVKTAGSGETLFTPGALRQGRGRLRDIKTDKHELRGHRDLLDARTTLQDTGHWVLPIIINGAQS